MATSGGPASKLLFTLMTLVTGASVDSPEARPVANTSSSVGHFGHLDGFTFPILSGGAKGGNIMFQGSFANSAAILLYDASEGTLLEGINTSTPVHNQGRSLHSGALDSNVLRLTGLGYFALANSGAHALHRAIAFIATAEVQMTEDSIDGIFLQGFGSSGVFPIITTQDKFEPIGATLSPFDGVSVAVSPNRRIIYVAFSAQAFAGKWSGIVLAAVTSESVDGQIKYGKKLTLIVDSHTRIPSTQNFTFKCLSGPGVSSNGMVSFFGSHCTTSQASPMVRSQRSLKSFIKTQTWQGHCLSHFQQRPGSDVYPGVFRWTQLRGIRGVATAASRVPQSGRKRQHQADDFVAFSDPVIGAGGTMAFVGLSSSGALGVYVSKPRSALQVIADTHTQIPGGSNVTFGDFPYQPSVGEGGDIVFYAAAQPPFSGIYSGSSAENSLRAELTLQNQISNQSLIYIGFGSHAFDANSDSFAAYLVLENGVDGVWSISRQISDDKPGNKTMTVVV